METGQEADSSLLERLKELNCLLRISKLLAQQDVDLKLILKQTVDILPQAFQIPQQTCARIIYQGVEYVTENFHIESEGIRNPILIDQKTAGFVEVFFLRNNTDPMGIRFLSEEQALLSAIADQVGMVIARKEAELSLRTVVGQLQEKSFQLENKNIALKELLFQIQNERESTLNTLRHKIEGSVLPALHKILHTRTADNEICEYARLAYYSLEEITSSFFRKDPSAAARLSPREMEVCGFIKRGLTTKEISSLLGLSIQTVEKHRYNIRRKMGIGNEKINLSVYLREG